MMSVYETIGTLILMVAAFLIMAIIWNIWKVTDLLHVGEPKEDKQKKIKQ